ncbi:MAG: galactokinase [Bacteroidia bacterium]|nr:MAG: galactokinase [Bacteroidia bacterium]
MKKTYFAAGRINLIGEHLDYNGGWVLPTTINLGISLEIKPHSYQWIFYSDKHEPFSCSFNAPFPKEHAWFQYPLSVIQYLQDQQIAIPHAYELNYHSNLPEGSGLSSSAAILVVTLKAFNEVLQLYWSSLDIAIIAQKIENQYIGVNCGIMDSYVIAYNEREYALLIDCQRLEHQKIPFFMEGKYKVLILDTQLPRSLKHSAYNERRTSCEQALQIIQQHKNIQNLAEATIYDLDFLNDDILKKRAKHVITEQERVKKSVKALENQDFITFGQLMNASHDSLKNDYQVSCEALDFLVENIQNQKGCLGARMTGAGFGGCAIAFIDHSFSMDYLPQLERLYSEKFSIQPRIFIGKE